MSTLETTANRLQGELNDCTSRACVEYVSRELQSAIEAIAEDIGWGDVPVERRTARIICQYCGKEASVYSPRSGVVRKTCSQPCAIALAHRTQSRG